MTTPTPRATLRPHERVRDPRDFRRAFDRRKTAANHAMVVYAVENDRDHPRLGISLGKKKVRKATGRNRIKRLLREAFRLNKADLPRGVDLIVVPRGPGLSFDEAIRSLPRLARDAARRLSPRSSRKPGSTAAEPPETRSPS